VTAAIAAGLGARTALVERALMGGDCLNFGCVPSKALLAAADAWHAARQSDGALGAPRAAGPGDFPVAMERMRALRAEISQHDSPGRFRDLGVDVYLGEGIFDGADRLNVGGRTLRFRRAVIATGTHAAVPPIDGLAGSGYLTNESVFSLLRRPARLLIIGGGAIGCEMAQAFARFGTDVTIVEAADRLLAQEDPDASDAVRAALEGEGVAVACGHSVQSVERLPDGSRRVGVRAGATDEFLVADEILVAVGRSPNVEGLGLEAAGVRFDPRSGVEVDDRLRTSNPRVYAVGDVVGPLRFTHLADAHARLVVRNALFLGRGSRSDLVVPWCTYTTPAVAHVGTPFPRLDDEWPGRDTVTVEMAEVDRAKLEGDTRGFLRVHLAEGRDRIVAATCVGEGAGEIISLLSVAMNSGIGLGKLGEAIYPYPTHGEIVRKAADAWRRRKLTPTARQAFSLYFRGFRLFVR
jgi:pyruvate/2-oxoglutarate dehydrogenase complex dihydrolipoamide dehydrogenase (E3) component